MLKNDSRTTKLMIYKYFYPAYQNICKIVKFEPEGLKR